MDVTHFEYKEPLMLKSYFAVWKPALNGLTEINIMGKIVLVNNTSVRIIHSPSVPTSCRDLPSHEIAVEPGEHVCYVKQDFSMSTTRESYVVITDSASEMAQWIGFYYNDPHLIPGDIRIRNGKLLVLDVPVSSVVFGKYEPKVKKELWRILKEKYHGYGRELEVAKILLRRAGYEVK